MYNKRSGKQQQATAAAKLSIPKFSREQKQQGHFKEHFKELRAQHPNVDVASGEPEEEGCSCTLHISGEGVSAKEIGIFLAAAKRIFLVDEEKGEEAQPTRTLDDELATATSRMGKLLQMAGQTNGEGGENGTGDEHDYEHRMSIPSVHGIWMQMIGPGGEVIRQFQAEFGVLARFLGPRFAEYPEGRTLRIRGEKSQVLKAVARVEQYVRGCSDRSKSGARYLLNSKVEEIDIPTKVVSGNAFQSQVNPTAIKARFKVDIQILSRGGGFTTFRLVGPGPAVAAARAHVDGLVTSLAVEQSGGQSSQKENPFFRRNPKENGGNDEEKGDRAESVATSDSSLLPDFNGGPQPPLSSESSEEAEDAPPTLAANKKRAAARTNGHQQHGGMNDGFATLENSELRTRVAQLEKQLARKGGDLEKLRTQTADEVDKLQAIADEMEESRNLYSQQIMCVCCLTKERRTMLQPCHHVATCVDCAEQLKRAAKPCPVRFCSAAAAGEPVRNWVQVFFK